MSFTLLVAGLKGAMFLETLPREFWPDSIYYYRVVGEHESAFQRLVHVAGEAAQPVDPRTFNVFPDSTLLVSVGWQYLIEGSENLVVLHDSLLPRFRGFAPTVTALVSGELNLGVTALLASTAMDSGPILSQHPVTVDRFVTIERAFEALADCYVRCLQDVLLMGSDLNSFAKPQDDSSATYSFWRDADDFQIQWDKSAVEIVQLVNAVGYPYAGAKTSLGNRALTVSRAELTEDLSFENRQPGKVWRRHDSFSVDVVCGSGIVRIWATWRDGDPAEVFSKLRLRLK
jgi:methionyl-tRNA formyltransferase